MNDVSQAPMRTTFRNSYNGSSKFPVMKPDVTAVLLTRGRILTHDIFTSWLYP